MCRNLIDIGSVLFARLKQRQTNMNHLIFIIVRITQANIQSSCIVLQYTFKYSNSSLYLELYCTVKFLRRFGKKSLLMR